MPLSEEHNELAIEMLKSGSPPDAVIAALTGKGAAEHEAREVVTRLVAMKKEAELLPRLQHLVRLGYAWTSIEKEARDSGLPQPQVDAILDELRSEHAVVMQNRAREEKEAAQRMELAAEAYKQEQSAKSGQMWGGIGIGIMLSLAGLVLTFAMSGRVVFYGLIVVGIFIAIRSFARGMTS
jgi:hypothetical protein